MVQRSKFWTVVFSLLPGAGHMFMGFMKQGLSLMGLFFGTIALGNWLWADVFLWLAPVVWFYAFFDCINKRFSQPEVFATFEDRFLFDSCGKARQWLSSARQRTFLGIGVVVLGGILLLQTLVDMWSLPELLQEVVNDILRHGPQFLIAAVIILIGIRLITGKKKELDDDETNA